MSQDPYREQTSHEHWWLSPETALEAPQYYTLPVAPHVLLHHTFCPLCTSQPGLNDAQRSHEVGAAEAVVVPVDLTDLVFCIPSWTSKNINTRAPIAVLTHK